MFDRFGLRECFALIVSYKCPVDTEMWPRYWSCIVAWDMFYIIREIKLNQIVIFWRKFLFIKVDDIFPY